MNENFLSHHMCFFLTINKFKCLQTMSNFCLLLICYNLLNISQVFFPGQGIESRTLCQTSGLRLSSTTSPSFVFVFNFIFFYQCLFPVHNVCIHLREWEHMYTELLPFVSHLRFFLLHPSFVHRNSFSCAYRTGAWR